VIRDKAEAWINEREWKRDKDKNDEGQESKEKSQRKDDRKPLQLVVDKLPND